MSEPSSESSHLKPSLTRQIAGIDKLFAWSFLGAVLGIVGLAATFFYEKKASLRFEIISNTSVLDIHEDLKDLQILFAGMDIRKSEEALSIATIRVVNDGSINILKDFYDNSDPVGLTLNSGKVISSEIVATSSEYLKKTAAIHYDEKINKLVISPTIIDAGEFLTIKILVLQKRTEEIGFSATGKIAGIKKLDVDYLYKKASQQTWYHKSFSGKLVYQIYRLLVYGMALLLLIFLISRVTEALSGLYRNLKLRSMLKSVKKRFHSTQSELAIDFYKQHGPLGVFIAKRLLSEARNIGRFNLLIKRISFSSDIQEIVQHVVRLINNGAVSHEKDPLTSNILDQDFYLTLKALSEGLKAALPRDDYRWHEAHAQVFIRRNFARFNDIA